MGNFGGVVAERAALARLPASATLVLPPLATLYLVFTPPDADQAADAT